MQRTISRLSNRIWSPTIHSTPARSWQASRHPRMPSQATAAPSLAGHDTSAFRPSDSRPPKRPAEGNRGLGKNAKKFKKDKKKPKEGGNEEVLAAEIEDLLATLDLAGKDHPPLPETGVEFDVKVVEQSSTGDGLALQEGSSHIYVVPFAFPGDTVRVKVHRHGPREQRHSLADFVSVVSPSAMRDDSRVRCQYYGRCGGCNFQPLSYEDQLAHKRRVVERAFAHFSGMPPGLLPPVGDTIGSPLQYGYRTKLTPHFDGAQSRKARPMTAVPDIGFLFKGRRRTLDIEDCPIGTEAVRRGMKRERARMAVEYGNYSRGATILLRETTQRFPKTVDAEGKSTASLPDDIPAEAVRTETDRYVDVKTCVSNPKGTSTEYIDDFVFENEANSFFQNNNSILPKFTAYVREHILPPVPTDGSSSGSATTTVRNLIDAYSGSGLFTIALSPIFGAEDKSSIGIDIDEKAIQKASENAVLNGLQNKVRFVANDAAHLFSEGAPANMDPDETVVVLDPPRKGCDAPFLRQLLAFGPRRVLYVSCNVHTQARDVSVLSRGHVDGEEKPEGGPTYEVESIRGFDFFPQTYHVEGVAVLNRVGAASGKTGAACPGGDAAKDGP